MTAAGNCLRGPAKTWYAAVRGDPTSVEYVTTWADFKEAMLANFSSTNPVREARDRLHNLVQTGSVRGYTALFRNLCAQIPGITEEEKLDRYIRGLKKLTRMKLRVEDPETFDKATRMAESFDANYLASARGETSSSVDGPSPMEVNATQMSKSAGADRQAVMTERRVKGLCLYCGSADHKVAQCPVAPKRDFRKPGNGQS